MTNPRDDIYYSLYFAKYQQNWHVGVYMYMYMSMSMYMKYFLTK